jgi:hypothetical protein
MLRNFVIFAEYWKSDQTKKDEVFHISLIYPMGDNYFLEVYDLIILVLTNFCGNNVRLQVHQMACLSL